MTTTPIIAIDDIAEIAQGGVSETPNFLSPDIISALQEDVIALLRAGAFVRGRLRLAAPACARRRRSSSAAAVPRRRRRRRRERRRKLRRRRRRGR
jgi:hypothetical protein